MKLTLDIIMLFLSIIWVIMIGKAVGLSQDAFFQNVLLGLGGCISSLFFYLSGLWVERKMRVATLHRIKERVNGGEMTLISHQERILLGALMKYFVKQPGKIANATNNIEGLCLYKVTEKMKRKLETV